jgi:hypothetical protein
MSEGPLKRSKPLMVAAGATMPVTLSLPGRHACSGVDFV